MTDCTEAAELRAQNEELRRALQNRKEQSVTWRRMYEKCAGERDMARKALHIAECRATGAAEQHTRALEKIKALSAELDATRLASAAFRREANTARGHRILAEERLKRLTEQVQAVDNLTDGYISRRTERMAERATIETEFPTPIAVRVHNLETRVERLESGKGAEDRRA
jgi:hypothetical protein